MPVETAGRSLNRVSLQQGGEGRSYERPSLLAGGAKVRCDTAAQVWGPTSSIIKSGAACPNPCANAAEFVSRQESGAGVGYWEASIVPSSDNRQRGVSCMGENYGAAPLAIRLFGSVEVEVGGEPLPKLRSRTELWLLALLALQAGRPAGRTWLAQSLWPFPDHAADLAAYNLRRALTNLRRALGVEAYRLQSPQPGALLLDLHGASVDAAVFAEAAARGDRASLETAVALYRGPLLLACTEPWAAAARADCEQRFLHCLRQLGGQALEAGDYPDAIGYLRRAIAVDPLSEPAQRALMETSHPERRHPRFSHRLPGVQPRPASRPERQPVAGDDHALPRPAGRTAHPRKGVQER